MLSSMLFPPPRFKPHLHAATMNSLLPRQRQGTFPRLRDPSPPTKTSASHFLFPVISNLDLLCRMATLLVITSLGLIFILLRSHTLYRRPIIANFPLAPSRVPVRPPPLSVHLPFERGTPFGAAQAEHSWLQPLVLTAYNRITKKPYLNTELFLYSTGISMGTFQRNISIVGCVVSDDVYPVVFTHFDSVMCRVPRPVEENESVTAAVAKDDALRGAMAGGVELSPGVVVELKDGDVYPMPTGWKLHFVDVGVRHEDMMVVKSVAKAGKSGGMKEEMGTEGKERYEVCMGTQMKMYPYLLEDWIGYHRRLGVDMVFVLDNDSEEDLKRQFGEREDVEVVYWPWGRSQVQAWSWLLVAARERCEWLLLADADEYVMFGVGRENEKVRGGVGLMREFVRKLNDEAFDEAFLQFIVMGNSGYDGRPEGALAEMYEHKYMVNETNGKSLLKTDTEWKGSNVHRGSAVDGLEVKTFWMRNSGIYPEERGEAGRMVHFQFRSWEERAVKERFGSGSIHDRHSVTGREIGEASSGYLRVYEEDRYTHFRKIWRVVMNEAWKGEQVLVGNKGGKKCRFAVIGKWLGEVDCGKDGILNL